MRVHSIETIPPVFEYDAYLPVEADDRHQESVETSMSPVFEVRAVRSVGTGMRLSRTRGRAPAFGVVRNLRPLGGTEDFTFLLETPGMASRIATVSPQIAEVLSDNSVMQNPQTLARKGWFTLRRTTVTFVPDPTQEPWINDVWLPTARIHRPARRGCRSMFSAAQTKASEFDASFDFGPVWVGGNVKFTVTQQQDLPASQTCKEAKLKATLTVLFGQTLVDGQVVSDGTRLILSNPRPETWTYEDIDRDEDGCGLPVDQAPKLGQIERNLMGASGGDKDAPTDRFGIATELSGRVSLSVGFSPYGQPLKIGVAYSRSCEYKCEIATTMMPGAHYLGYQPHSDNPFERCWSVLEQQKRRAASIKK